MPAVKEPINLMRDDNKRLDGTTLLPWAREKPMAWDVAVPDIYAESHIGNTATKPGAAAQKTAQNKIDKYSRLAMWRCLSYRASAGGYLLIECRGVAALQMRSSQ